MRFIVGATLLGLGIAFGLLRAVFGWYTNPTAIDGGLLLIFALVGPGIYLVSTAVDDMRHR